MSQTSLRRVYASLLQVEYLLALSASFALGASNYWLFTICLLLTIALGFVTNALYWHIQDRTVRENSR